MYPRNICWIGDSLKVLKEFPKQVQKDIGDALNDVQHGVTPPFAKPLKNVGNGVFEIVSRLDKNTYRTVYTFKIGRDVYVLHAFQKKSHKGIETAQKDIDLIKKRYRKALEIEKGKI